MTNISRCRCFTAGDEQLHPLISVDETALEGVGIGHAILVSGELAALELLVWVPVWLGILHLCYFQQKRAVIGAGDACRLWSWNLPGGGYIPNGNVENSTPGCWSARWDPVGDNGGENNSHEDCFSSTTNVLVCFPRMQTEGTSFLAWGAFLLIPLTLQLNLLHLSPFVKVSQHPVTCNWFLADTEGCRIPPGPHQF